MDWVPWHPSMSAPSHLDLPAVHAWRRWRAWALLALVLALAWALALGWLANEREALRHHEGEKLEGLVRTLDGIVAQQMIAAHAALQTVASQAPGWRPAQLQQDGEPLMRTLTQAMPGVRALLLLDAQGQVRASSHVDLLQLDLHQHAAVLALRAQPQAGMLYLSPPLLDPPAGHSISLARLLFDHRDRPVGLVMALLDPHYFGLLLQTAQPSEQTWAALAHQDGMLFTLAPEQPELMGRNLLERPGSVLQQHLSEGREASLQLAHSRLTDDLRLVATRSVHAAGLPADKQLVVAVGRTLASVEAPWLRQRQALLQLGLALSLGAALTLWLWQRRRGLLARLRQQAAQALKAQAEQTQAILDNMVDGVITIDRHGVIASINPAACRMFGYQARELLGGNVNRLMAEPERSLHDAHIKRYLEGGAPRVIGLGRDVNGLRKDGQSFPMSLAVSHIERDGEPLFIGLTRDITERKRAEAAIEQLAFYDPLTGLPNRRLLLDRLHQALAASRRGARQGAVLFIDLDNFKSLNDTLGHGMGDRMLQAVAKRLQASLRAEDTVARWGGDEFVVLLQDLGQDARRAALHAEAAGEKLLRVLGQPYHLDDSAHHSTPSIGIVMWGEAESSAEELLKHADHALYQAKAAGRNRLCFFDPVTQAAMAELALLEADLRQAVNYQQFELHYQAQVDADGRLLGAEALLRWQHPQRGWISPAQFIPLAEHCGVIGQLGEWVLQQSCAQLSAWAQVPALAGLSLAVNLSAHQFRQKGLLGFMQQLLARSGAPTDKLKLELTESALVEDVEAVIALMGELRRLGLRFSLDDFGTGYSSLAYLKRLPLDQLKIDQSFVRDLLTEPNAQAIARAVIQLGDSLGLAVIAEGVETEAQMLALRGQGCHAFQGYFFARPLPLAEFEALAHKLGQ